MRILTVFLLGLAGAASVLAQAVTAGDARHGAELFRSEQCVMCHMINGQGGATAPDLSKRLDRNMTPNSLVSLMWNHAPQMWDGMRSAGIRKAELPPESAADLMAYFLAARFFEKPGDAGRGKQLFAGRHCGDCHGINESKAASATPVKDWQSLADPVTLVNAMWSHSGKMREAFKTKGFKWAQLSGQELTDILVYLKNVPETRKVEMAASPSGPEINGTELFQSKCAGCHKGTRSLDKRLKNMTLTEIAADMWNHVPNMGSGAPALTEPEMRQILQAVWARQFFQSTGIASRGKKVFADKKCVTCHSDALKGSTFTATSMLSVLWDHGPKMMETMASRKVAWPRFDGSQMADLIAYLNTRK